MFESQKVWESSRKDFKVSFLQYTEEGAEILVGPRFRPHFMNIVKGNNDPDSLGRMANAWHKDTISQTNFENFYCPESANPLLYNYLKTIEREDEISMYEPSYHRAKGDQFPVYGAGKFVIPKGEKTLFWMKVPYPGNSSFNYRSLDFIELQQSWTRLENGANLPTNIPSKVDKNGKFSYTLYIPVFSIMPKGLNMNIEYFDIGEIRYFSDNYIQNDKERAFLFDKISDYHT